MQVMSHTVALNAIPNGSGATVVSLHHDAEITRRLLELGITKGTSIVVTGTAPLGDPMMIRVRGCQIAMRKSEAEQIDVLKDGAWTLDAVPAGRDVLVTSVHHAEEVTTRLLELGVTRGSRITVTGKAPLGDPMFLRVRGCQIAIRGKDARSVQVELA